MTELDVHTVPGPYISGEPATYISIHGSRGELRLIQTLIDQVDPILALGEPQPCQQNGADGCCWLHLVAMNNVDPASIGNAYLEAVDHA